MNIRRPVRLLLALSACAAFPIAFTCPLALRASSTVLGAGAGDNVTFLWNFWWMREALRQGHDFFDCPAIFAP